MSEEKILKSETEIRELIESINIPREILDRKLPEWRLLENLMLELVRLGEVRIVGWTTDGQYKLPLIGMSFGNRDPEAPTLLLTGGVHGLERIGAQVVLQLGRSFAELSLWDKLLQDALGQIRIAFFPMVNPLGMLHKTRATPSGVDLMRNAPTTPDPDDKPSWLLGGQRYSPHLPWYMGDPNKMEPEGQALVDFTIAESFRSSRVFAVDFHSGFGTNDQIWFPYAKSHKPFAHLAEMHSLKEAFERTHPHHFYQIEPMSQNYTTQGDCADYIYDLYQKKGPKKGVFLPMTVEMGSWIWIRKNPSQVFSILGAFNPMVPHRLKRALRRHNSLFDFLVRALVSPTVWVPSLPEQREKHRERAMELWYAKNED